MKSFLLPLLALLSSLGLQAQITVTSSTLPAIGDKLRYSWAYNQATFGMITPPGFDEVWDFTVLTADESIEEVYIDPSLGQYAYRFPGANIMTKNAAGEERYFVVSGSGLRLIGWTENKLFGEPFTVVYDFTRDGRIPNAGINERFTPLNFFDTYAQNANILEGYKFYDLPPALVNAYLAAGLTTTDSIRLRYSYSNFQSVNASGTLTIPGPNPQPQYPVLRQNTTQYREGRVDAHVIPLGWLDITDLTMQYFPASIANLGVDTTGAHTFFNDVVKEEIARITLNAEGRPHDVRFKNNTPPSCFDPDLVNATLNGDPIAPGNYAASQTITSAGRVATLTTVQFTAGIQIALQPGFIAEAGSGFTAKVINCPAGAAPLVITEDQEIARAPFPIGPTGQENIPRLLSAEGRLSIYPNPVHHSAKIDYSLSGPGPVWVGISDMNGRLLQALKATDWQEAGEYSVNWMPANSSPGVYYALLKTNEGVVSKKMVLIR
ncbi:MAG: T9SS type A sorting domain-containing protein [Saprospiraceae bacterium]|nr:T9SS type A sorting domain-containing protein [Lewinella sp.]